MPTVAELTALYGNFMLSPRRGPGVCRTCLNLTDGYDRCYACTLSESWLDAVSPISYSVAHEQLHHALAGYKRPPDVVAERFAMELAAILWRHLAKHEACLVHAVGIQAFDLVTPVPSSMRERDRNHPLHRIVGELVGVTRARHDRLLRRSETFVEPRTFSADKYEPTTALRGRSVLLIDDTWTTGANAQSAAAALKSAGAGPVAAVVIGRHVNREWHQNDQRLRRLSTPFDWEQCALCARGKDRETR
jgi:predicted amidophosphoribosyltransferase